MTFARPRMWLRDLEASHPKLLKALAWFGLAFWLYYAFLRQVAGPLNFDEIYFAHHLWLLNQGKRQYVDFFSGHLPAYFHLLKPLVSALSQAPADLAFVFGVRALSALVIAAYLALAWVTLRKAFPDGARAGLLGSGAVMLVFVVLARMVELRSDTFGLLLVNAAWAAALCTRTPRTTIAACVLAGLALLFSARAAGMVAVMGLLLFYLAVRSHDWASVRAMLWVAGLFAGGALLMYLADPEWVALVVRSCFLEPARSQTRLPLTEILFAPERLPLTVLIVAGLGAGILLLRRGNAERGLVIAVACAAQVLMILADPAPHQYVYGWAALPAVAGLVSASGALAVVFPAAIAAAVLGASVGYSMLHGEPPRASSYFRLTFDARLGEDEVARLATPALVAMLVNDKRQMNLGNQLRVRSEVCRRLRGAVLTTFDTHPVCLDDAMFHWTGQQWPPLVAGEQPRRGAMSQEAFEQAFAIARPRLFIWGRRYGEPRTLLPAARQMLACCYDIGDGFAIAREIN